MANSQLPSGSDATISIPLAKAETTAWRNYLATSDLITESFEFPVNTIHSLIMGTPQANGIRIYLALKTPGDPTSLTVLLVPTEDGKDIIVNPQVPGTVGGDDDTNIYNFSRPCPPTCPPPDQCLQNW